MTNPEQITIVIADDHPMLLQGLRDTLTKSGFNVAAMARDGTSALQAIMDLRPDLAIVDVEMPYLTGFAIAEACQRKDVVTRFIILSYHKEAEFIVRAKKLNISGYLLKEDTSIQIFRCIEHVMNGKSYYSPSIIQENLDYADKNLIQLASLSPSEKKILKMIAGSLSSQEIADQLHVSERTIEKHRSNIISKLGLTGRVHGLSLWACEQKSVIMSL